jgi:hypothetical protein
VEELSFPQVQIYLVQKQLLLGMVVEVVAEMVEQLVTEHEEVIHHLQIYRPLWVVVEEVVVLV